MVTLPVVDRPVLFLDVDGPLIPFGWSLREYAIPEGWELLIPLLAGSTPELEPRKLEWIQI
jgi:hypothetical protein